MAETAFPAYFWRFGHIRENLGFFHAFGNDSGSIPAMFRA
jgi:hypothetical protein